MKRLFCLLLSALMILSLCACSPKKEEQKKTAEPKVTEKKQEQTQSQTNPGEIADPDENAGDGTEIGTLPIIFEEDDQKKPDDPSSETTPPTTSSSTQPPILGGDSGTVVETPIIPLN